MPRRALLLAAAALLATGCTASEASSGEPRVESAGGSSPASLTEVTVAPSGPITSKPPPTTSFAHPAVTDNRVYVVGDSIAESIASRYSGLACDALNPLGWDVTVDAVQGRNTGQAVQSLRAHRTGVGQIVVVLIGHNDAIDPEGYRSQIDRLIELVPEARRIVLLTNYEFERGRDRMNEVLREMAAVDGAGGGQDRIELVDWHAAVDALDGAIQRDGIHLTSTGQEALAATIAGALGPAPTATSIAARKPVCTTLRGSSTGPRSGGSGSSGSGSGSGGSGSGGSGGSTVPASTTPQTGASTAPATEAPPTAAPPPPDTVVTSEPPTTGKRKPPPTSDAPPTSAGPLAPDASSAQWPSTQGAHRPSSSRIWILSRFS